MTGCALNLDLGAEVSVTEQQSMLNNPRTFDELCGTPTTYQASIFREKHRVRVWADSASYDSAF